MLDLGILNRLYLHCIEVTEDEYGIRVSAFVTGDEMSEERAKALLERAGIKVDTVYTPEVALDGKLERMKRANERLAQKRASEHRAKQE